MPEEDEDDGDETSADVTDDEAQDAAALVPAFIGTNTLVESFGAFFA